jgi:hypothetical protein
MSECDFKVRGDELLKKVKELVKEGNVRKIIIKDEKGKEYLHIPVNVGIIGAIFAPVLVAVGAIAAMASCFTIEVVRKEKSEKPKPTEKK